MDISLMGAQHLNSAYVPLSSASQARAGINSGGDNTFEAILRKTQGAKSAEPTNPPPSRNPPVIDKTDKLYEACLELETFLVKNLMKSMRSTVQKSNFIDTGFAGEMYEDMLYDEYAKTYAKNAGFGFAEMAYRELSGIR